MASPFDKLALPSSAIGAAGEGFVPKNIHVLDVVNSPTLVNHISKRKPKMQRLYFRRDVRKQHMWLTGEGESINIEDMEDSHVQNTLNYITRRSQQWEVTRELARERNGVDVGEYIINGKAGREWFDIFVTEIKKRQETR